MAFIFSSLSKATPELLRHIMVPLISVIVLGILGLIIVAPILGKKLGYSKSMSISLSLTALYGFPANYLITNEVIKARSKNKTEEEILQHELMPKMLVAGFSTVTVISVLIAGIFIKLI